MFLNATRRLLLSGVLIMPLSATAQDAALLLGQERYEQLDRVRRAEDILRAQDRLDALGFTVTSRANGRVNTITDLAGTFAAQVDGADRLVVALSGHFVTDGTRTWLLSAESVEPGLFTVEDAALSVDSVLRVLAMRPSQAVLLIGAADPDDLDIEDNILRAGVGRLDVPQGVTVLRTTPSSAASVLRGVLTEPGAVIGEQLAQSRDIEVDGYLPDNWVLMPELDEVEARDPTLQPVQPTTDLDAEAAAWDRATALDTVEGYREYVARYPRGRFVNDAETQIAAFLAEPNRDARLTEEALGLNRAARREIQADLTLLNYDTRGVDGIFGPGSRGAIMNWQQSNGFPQSSYLTRDQINLLDAQAARREAEIAAQEERERAQAEARDRAYWGETGALGGEAGYRAYLSRFEDGLFADIARARLGEIEDARRTQAEAQDRAAWSNAESANTRRAYREYLAAYPSGVFADTARERIAEFDEPRVSNTQVRQARSEEEDLRLRGVRAQLLELGLRDLGFDPGRLDGRIDDATRRAIRAYQQSKGITPTGFVDRATAVGLLTGSIGINLPGR